MVRNLKVLTLAVVAALAMCALAASSASAWFTWEGEGDPPIATGSAAGFQVFYNAKEELGCEEVSFDNSTVFGGLITVAPTFGKCTLTGEGFSYPAHVEPTSCHLEFHTDWALGVDCPTETEMHVSITVGGLKFNCLTIPSQKHGERDNKTVFYTNEGSGATSDILVSVLAEGLEYTKQGVCGEGAFNDGGYTGEITVKGDDPVSKKQIGISWDDH